MAHDPSSSEHDHDHENKPIHTADTEEVSKFEHIVTTFSVKLLDGGNSLIYAIVGVCFFLGSLFALGYSFWHFDLLFWAAIGEVDAKGNAVDAITKAGAIGKAIIQFVSDLLLVLIIMEVLGTVIHYLRARATSLRPFLFIGIISATRGILSIGARLSVEGTSVTNDDFRNSMIELGINGLVILALGVTIKLLGRHVDDN